MRLEKGAPMPVEGTLRDTWAVIPAAGVGARLRPHTYTTPKAMLHVAGRPIIGHILDRVAAAGIERVALIVGAMGDQVVDYARRTHAFREVAFRVQTERKGLGHAIWMSREVVADAPALIVYGDTIFEGDLTLAFEADADGAIGVKRVDDPSRFGVVRVEGDRIVGLVEKPTTFVSDLAIPGVNFFRNTALLYDCLNELIERGIVTLGEYQATDAFAVMIERGGVLKPFPVEAWYDCGAPDAVLDTNRHLLEKLPPPDLKGQAIVVPPAFVASSARVKNAVIGPHVSIAEGATVENAVVRDSIIGANAVVRDCVLDRSLVGNGAVVQGGAQRLNVGDSSEIIFR
ncbi:MAG: nucleotidyl transferase [Candidatus Latescibacteria bacterium]|nr:nucleotidyl transferase [Candidatus Latescibacterota bacterium]